MKNLDLKNYGVTTMSTREMETSNGGCQDWICYHHLDIFLKDFIDGFNAGSGAEC